MKKRIGNALTILGLLACLIGFGGFFLPFFHKDSQHHVATAGYYKDTEGDSRGWRIAERFVCGLGVGAALILLGAYLCDEEQPKKESKRFRDSPRGRRAMLSISILALAALWSLILFLLVLAVVWLWRSSGERSSLEFKSTVVLALAAALIVAVIPIQVVRYARERSALR
mgnify:CR=1 FL=1